MSLRMSETVLYVFLGGGDDDSPGALDGNVRRRVNLKLRLLTWRESTQW